MSTIQNTNPTQADLEKVKSALAEALYTNATIPMCTLYFAQSLLNQEGDWPNTLFLGKLSSEMRQSSKIRAHLRNEQPNIITEIGDSSTQIIKTLCPDTKFSIEAREKSLFSEVNKRVCKYLKNGSPVIQDLLAMRIIILNDDTEERNIRRSYEVANKLLENFTRLHNTTDTNLSWDISVKDANAIKDCRDSVKRKYPSLTIPLQSGLYPIFNSMVKDYVYYPNETGYQSIQFIIVYRGVPVELQIRTLSMHHWATSGAANHENYKEKRSFKDVTLSCFNEDLIKMPKFMATSNGVIPYPGIVSGISWYCYTTE